MTSICFQVQLSKSECSHFAVWQSVATWFNTLNEQHAL